MAVKNRVRELWLLQKIAGNDVGIQELADAVGVSRQTINTYMNNNMKSYNSDALDKLCRYFKVPIGQLLYNDPEVEAQ